MDETTAARERIRHKGKPSFAKVTNLDRVLTVLKTEMPFRPLTF